MRKPLRRPGPALAAVFLGSGAIALAVCAMPYGFAGDPSLLESGEGARIERDRRGIAFVPESAPKDTGLVFYCGAKVPPEAYAYLGRACARAGYTAVFPAFPLNIAFFDPGAAAKVAAARPGVLRWAIGGHSLGGSMACSYLARNPSMAAGLFLLAAHPRGAADLSGLELPATVVSGSKDGLAVPAEIRKAAPRLPPSTRFVEITGGNHAQFGEYGSQRGDGTADIPASVQGKAAAEEALALLGLVEAGTGR